jgi:XTP/dITP diphosphohydrolase
LGGVPKGLPSIVKAQRIQEKAAGIGFDWDKSEQIWLKVQEEITEFEEEVSKGDLKRSEEEFGDVLFSLINYARFLKINPDNALELTNQKFIKRFEFFESKAKELEKKLSDMSLSEMETIWKEAKNQSSSSDSNNC